MRSHAIVETLQHIHKSLHHHFASNAVVLAGVKADNHGQFLEHFRNLKEQDLKLAPQKPKESKYTYQLACINSALISTPLIQRCVRRLASDGLTPSTNVR